jgi:hypothetical protein
MRPRSRSPGDADLHRQCRDPHLRRANPALSGTVTGFVGSDTQAHRHRRARWASRRTATAASNVGSYLITARASPPTTATTSSSRRRPMHRADHHAGDADLHGDAASRLYGAANPALGGTVTGFVNGETQAGATTGRAVLHARWRPRRAMSARYLISGARASRPTTATTSSCRRRATHGADHHPATLTYTADAATRTYGAANPALSGTVTGFVNSRHPGQRHRRARCPSTLATAASNVGSYLISGARA